MKLMKRLSSPAGKPPFPSRAGTACQHQCADNGISGAGHIKDLLGGGIDADIIDVKEPEQYYKPEKNGARQFWGIFSDA